MESSYGLWCRELTPAMMNKAHAHGDVEWNFVVTGTLAYRHAGRDVTLQPRRLTVFWAGLPHRTTACSPDCRVFIGVLPVQQFLAWKLSPAVLTRLTAGAMLSGPEDVHGDDTRMLQRWSQQLPAGARQADLAVLEMQARFGRLLGAYGDDLAEDMGQQQADGTVARLVGLLTERYAENLRIADIAAAVGVHPKYAQHVFKKSTGLTPWQFLLRYRVVQAQRLLLAEVMTISAIAQQVGFGSEASFGRAFKKYIGTSPGQWRRGVRVGSDSLAASGLESYER